MIQIDDPKQWSNSTLTELAIQLETYKYIQSPPPIYVRRITEDMNRCEILSTFLPDGTNLKAYYQVRYKILKNHIEKLKRSI